MVSVQPATEPGEATRRNGAPGGGPRPRSGNRALLLWRSSIGKKWVMAVSGLLMVLYLLAHMIGNLKIFFGRAEFDSYAAWLRDVGEPALHHEWFLWITRVVLFVAVVLHVTAAVQLSARDHRARPVKYAHGQRWQAQWSPRSMRWGGVGLALFIVWHILDLTAGVVNPSYHGQGYQAGHVYANVYHDFHHWWSDVIYIVAMVCVGLHINHGFWSATQTLGLNRPRRDRAIRATGTALAVIISVGFVMVPVGVMTGIVK